MARAGGHERSRSATALNHPADSCCLYSHQARQARAVLELRWSADSSARSKHIKGAKRLSILNRPGPVPAS
jgi:hypothetical protein